MDRRTHAVLFLALLFACGLAVVVQAAAPELTQWSPGESYPGGRQADARLDKPVTFWAAGAPLAEVFAELEKQTGVALAFSPADDENRRVPVNLFLNREQPPALSDLLVQLAWAVDCPFFVTEGSGPKVYYLMSTSIGQGAEKNLHAVNAAKRQAHEKLWAAMREELAEYRKGLGLARDEAIREYLGKDDLVLLNLLDPQRRAATEFVCRQVAENGWDVGPAPNGPLAQTAAGSEADSMRSDNHVDLVSFSPEDVTKLMTAFNAPESVVRDEKNGGIVFTSEVTLSEARLALLPPGPYMPVNGPPGYPIIVLPARPLEAEERARLAAAVGEETAAQGEAQVAAAAQQREDERRRLTCTLSARAEERLSAAPVTFPPGADLSAAAIQEAVARASGYHVVSDGFAVAQLGLRAGTASQDSSARGVLERLWQARTRDMTLRNPAWEWGDAGGFLRFRSTNRDVGRAALLPESFLHWVETAVAPSLPRDPQARAADFTLPIDLRAWSTQLGRLSPMQLQYAASLGAGAGTGLSEQAAREVVQAVLSPIMNSTWAHPSPGLFGFLASLTDDQWARAQAQGLSAPADVTAEQQRLLDALLTDLFHGPAAKHSGIQVKIETGSKDSAADGPRASVRHDPTYVVRVEVLQTNPQGQEVAFSHHRNGFLPSQVKIHVEVAKQ